MQITPYLSFDGKCAEAFRFYEQTLRGKIAMTMTYGESPMAAEFPPEARDRVLHIRLDADGAMLLGSDAPPGRASPMQGITVTLDVKEEAEAERLFAAFANGGTVQMPIAQTFWAKRFGMVTDRFGTPWMINCA
jgi:PhnB protein